MISSQIINDTTNTTKELEFPILARSTAKIGQIIVMFNSSSSGMIISSGDSSTRKVGEYYDKFHNVKDSSVWEILGSDVVVALRNKGAT